MENDNVTETKKFSLRGIFSSFAVRTAGVLCSMTLLAAPAANQCQPAPQQLPCDVATVLQNKCQSCHGSPLAPGVPVPLLTYADTQATSVENPTVKVWQSMGTKVSANLMPPAPATLTAAEKTTIMNWVGAGAPAGTQTSCP